MRQVAGPDRRRHAAAAELHAYRDLALLHDALAVFLAIVGVAPALLGHPDVIQIQVELGDIGYVTLLSSEQTYQLSVIALVQAQTNRFADTAALFQALGGGWWNQDENSHQ